jgi:DNA-binding transcriptional LysR family regulator
VAGLGIGYLPDYVMEDHLASGALVPVMPRFPLPEAGMYVIRPPGAHPARKVRALIEILIEHFGESGRTRTATRNGAKGTSP